MKHKLFFHVCSHVKPWRKFPVLVGLKLYEWCGFKTPPIHKVAGDRKLPPPVPSQAHNLHRQVPQRGVNSILSPLFVMLEYPRKLDIFSPWSSISQYWQGLFNTGLENTLRSHPSLPHTIKDPIDMLYRTKLIGYSISCQTLGSGICQEGELIGWGSFQCNQNHSLYNWAVCEINVFFHFV